MSDPTSPSSPEPEPAGPPEEIIPGTQQLLILGGIARDFAAVKKGTVEVVSMLASLVRDQQAFEEEQRETLRHQQRDLRWAKWFRRVQSVASVAILVLVTGFLVTFIQRSDRSRDRAQCQQVLSTNYQQKFAEAVDALSRTPRDQQLVDLSLARLARAKQLLNEVPTRCYGENPDPTPPTE